MYINMPLWWTCVLCFALAFGLSACDSPSMAFSDIPAKKLTVEGSDFSVRHTNYEAEVIRTNAEWAPTRREIILKAVKAIETTSGCAVLPQSVRGDTNIIVSDIACPGVPESLRPVRPKRLSCTAYEVGGIGGDGMFDIDCLIAP